jgi:histidinol-phosphate/aromatic aminotransferase/cobyric acid decarboxylase-like protein
MLRPIPSWANFLLARVERGDAILFERELAERGIIVHRPPQPELAEHLRISAVGPESTLELKRALIEISVTL